MKVLLLLGVLFTNNAFATQITANGSNDTIKSDNIVNDKALHTSLLVAYEKYKKLAKTDNVRAKVKLFALFFDNAEQLESKSEEAFTFLTEAAHAGDMEAEYYLGMMTSGGYLTKKDMTMGNKWLTRAANKGYKPANIILAMNLMIASKSDPKTELITNEDLNSIREYLNRAKDEKTYIAATAMSAFGQLLYSDRNDFKEAKKWLLKAHELGDEQALRLLEEYQELEVAKSNNFIPTVNYDKYKGPDPLKEYEKYKKQALTGDVRAKLELFLLFFDHARLLESKAKEAITFLVEAARAGDMEAEYNLGLIASYGHFIEENVRVGNEWLTSSAKKGYKHANILLAANLITDYKIDPITGHISDEDLHFIRDNLQYAEELGTPLAAMAMRHYGKILYLQKGNLKEAKKWLLKAHKFGDKKALKELEDYERWEG